MASSGSSAPSAPKDSPPPPSSDTPSDARPAITASLTSLSVAALGVVFGDIGTSPLYTFKTVLNLAGERPDSVTVLGSLSLVIWTLIVVTSIKYVAFAMRINNDGEGGILALMSLLGVKARRPAIVAVGLFGAALIYGDGAITPAISVLSALEGLKMVAPSFNPYVLPAAVAVLIALFAIQPQGTARIGKAFGPIMTLWFLVIGTLGVWGIAQHPAVLWALDPRHAIEFLFHGGFTSFVVLGGVFLCVTGAEALYADMGQFGPKPIRLTWSALVFPSLVLNYVGQGALVLAGAPAADNIFFRLCPSALLLPMVALATIATIIASQSIITGAFSMTRQAIQLGWMPRLPIKQTSSTGYGQIYVGPVNWLLMLVTLGLTMGFGKSDNLAAAYGIAVSVTMLMTSALLFIAMREVWHWSLPAAGAVAGCFILVDSGFVAANSMKIADGGYVPLLLAAAVYGVMWIWHRGAQAEAARVQDYLMPIDKLLAQLVEEHIPRVPGTAVFLTRTQKDAPPVLVWHLKHNRALHERVFILTTLIEPMPRIHQGERLKVQDLAPRMWRATARFGFMERPDIPALLRHANALGCNLKLEDVTYYVGHETVIHRDDGKGLPLIVERAFAYLQRNSTHVSDYYRLPADSVVELGREIAI
ncbi:MAG TPA: KUP/HAK/KT family potassium transporter [Steroidobacteraceae bacterium]|nr:KUP/HAK/KT family potassium transporter [Steroidobacteraceae bacterium]